jgi:hypothetical protein
MQPFGTATTFLVLILATRVGGQPESKVKEFAADLEQLNGSWLSPKMEFAPGVTGRFELKLEFKKDSTVGQATVLHFASKNGIIITVGPWSAELKEKDKKRFIVLAETKGGKRAELAEIGYEITEGKLKLTSQKAFPFEKGGKPIETSGDWERKKAKK